MGTIIAAALLPHPPIMVPEVGGAEVQKIYKTVNATTQVATYINKYKPDTVVILSPHGPMFRNAMGISLTPMLCGNFARFGAGETALEFVNDTKMAQQISVLSARRGVPVIQIDEATAARYRLSLELDHGALVPLYYLHEAGFRGEVVYATVGMLDYAEMEAFGAAVHETAHFSNKKIAVIASGDLSHRLLPDAPAGFNPRGKEFDEQVLAAMRENSLPLLRRLPDDLVEDAGQCGLRPIHFLLSVVAELTVKTELLSYEGPFGVGYAVVIYKPALDSKGEAI